MARVALVSRATAPYLRALHESFSQSLGAGGRLDVLWPEDVRQTAAAMQCMPAGEQVAIHTVAAPHAPAWLSRLLSVSRQERVMPRLPSGAVWRQLRVCNPDLVWIHEYSPFTIEALLFAKWHRLPVVVSSEVGRSNAAYFGRVVQAWHRAWGHLVDGVIACCPAARQPLAGTAAPVCEAYHAVDSRVFLPAEVRSSYHDPVFVYVGSLIERKGVDLLIAAAALLRSRGGAPFRLRFVGGGSPARMQQLAAGAGLEACCEFTGRLEGGALREAVRSADVFVLPTRQDTYAAVVHEAACLGLPLIVSRHAGAAGVLVREGGSGFIIDPADTSAFADRMQVLLDAGLRQRMAAEARARGDELSAHRRGPAVWRWMKQEFLSGHETEASAGMP